MTKEQQKTVDRVRAALTESDRRKMVIGKGTTPGSIIIGIDLLCDQQNAMIRVLDDGKIFASSITGTSEFHSYIVAAIHSEPISQRHETGLTVLDIP